MLKKWILLHHRTGLVQLSFSIIYKNETSADISRKLEKNLSNTIRLVHFWSITRLYTFFLSDIIKPCIQNDRD